MVCFNNKLIVWSIMFLDAEWSSADWDAVSISFNVYHNDWLIDKPYIMHSSAPFSSSL